MKRGDIVTVAVTGDYGKTRPAVIVQSDMWNVTDSVLVSLMTSSLFHASWYRISIEPNSINKLKTASQIMIDKIMAVPRIKCGKVIGRLRDEDIIELNRLLSLIMGLAG